MPISYTKRGWKLLIEKCRQYSERGVSSKRLLQQIALNSHSTDYVGTASGTLKFIGLPLSLRWSNSRGIISRYKADLLLILFGFSWFAYVDFRIIFTCLVQTKRVKQEISGQSYKHFTLVNYDSRVIPDLKILQITTLE